eukprot:1116321-Alexandrium_andersonii.AAC.1
MAISRPRTPSRPAFVGRFGSCAKDRAERTPRELRGAMLRPFLGPRSSSFERLKRCCVLRMADCGLRRIAARTGRGQIADCTLGTLQCKDARFIGSFIQSLSHSCERPFGPQMTEVFSETFRRSPAPVI